MKKFFNKKKKVKASYTVEAAAVVPIVVVITVIIVLAFRMISLGSVIQLAKEEASIMFSAKMTRLQYAGVIDEYLAAPEGGVGLSDFALKFVDNMVSKEDWGTDRDYALLGGDIVNNTNNYSDVYGTNYFRTDLKDIYGFMDQYGCDYSKLHNYYNNSIMGLKNQGDLGKQDYEQLFSYIFEKRVRSNLEAYENSKFTPIVFTRDDVKTSDWKFEVTDSQIKYTCKLSYEIKVPLPFTTKTVWSKETDVVGYVSRR